MDLSRIVTVGLAAGRGRGAVGLLAVVLLGAIVPAAHADLFVSAGTDTVYRLTPSGQVSPFASGFPAPNDLAFNAAGDLFVADPGGTVSRVTPSGQVSPFVSGFNAAVGLAFGLGEGLPLPPPGPAVAVPEPGSAWLLGLAVAALALARRRPGRAR